MDDPGSSPIYLILIFLLIGVNAFFAMSEVAVISLNDARLHHDAENGSKKARILAKLMSEPNSFLATVQVAVTISGFVSSAVAADVYADPVTNFIIRFIPLNEGVVHGAVVFLMTVLLSYISIVLGELVPKRVAMHYPDKISYGVSEILMLFSKIFRPFVKFLSLSTNAVLRLMRIDPEAEPESATEENIRMMLDAADEKGIIEESEKEMINNIFDLDDTGVGEVMTHRKDITAIEIGSNISEAIDLAISDGYSRMPVFEETIDNIKGVVYAKDLLTLIGEKNFAKRKVEDFIRPISFIPESNSCKEAFLEFQQKKIQAAIVIDEYGGTAGLVSMEDLIESVMGNIQDEYDNEEEEINAIDEKNFDFEGTVLLDDIEELLDIAVDVDCDYDTLSGLIMDLLGRIPEEDEQPVVQYQGVEFTVMQVEEHRIAKVHARIIKDKNPEGTE